MVRMTPRATQHLVVAVATTFIVACSSGGDSESGTRTEGALRIAPSHVLLTQQGESYELSVVDADGNPVSGGVAWESSSADVLVDGSGVVSSAVDVGSALVSATRGGETLRAATVMVAEPVEPALLVRDSQIVSDPAPVDADAPRDLGTQFTVMLAEVAPPEPGTIVLAKEAAPLAGRVVSSEPRGDSTLVTLEAVALNELFVNLELTQTFALSNDDIEITDPDALVTELDDGTLLIEFPELANDDVEPAQKLGEKGRFTLPGGVDCRSELTPTFRLVTPSIKIKKNLDFDTALVVREGFLARFLVKVEGSLSATSDLLLEGNVALVGEIKCRKQISSIKLPVGGPLAALVAPSVPFGVGVDLEGELEVAKLALGATAELGVTLTLGFEYLGAQGFSSLNDFSVKGSFEPFFEFPVSLTDDIRAQGSLHGYGYVGFGVVFLPILQAIGLDLEVQIVDLNFGPRFLVSLGTPLSQALDTRYASEFRLSLFGKAGLSEDIKDALKYFGGLVRVIPPELSFEADPYTSPKGRISASTLNGVVGEPVRLRIELENDSTRFFRLGSPFPGAYSVRAASLHRLGDELELIWDDPQPEDGQTSFEAVWIPEEEDVGVNTFVAFTNTETFTFFDDYLLEIAADSRVSVSVRDVDDPPPPDFGPIGAFESPTGLRESRAFAINDQGLVTGGSTGTPQGKGFRWQPGLAMVDLGSPVSEPQVAVVIGGLGINEAGVVVGNFRSTYSPPDGMAPEFTAEQPFRWSGGAMVSLNQSVDTEVWKQLRSAVDINDASSIVGVGQWKVDESTRGRGYIWRGGMATSLGPDDTSTEIPTPTAINNSDEVVGAFRSPGTNPRPRAFVWREGSLEELVGGGFAQSEALDINNAGEIVGWAGPNISTGRAFLWLPSPAHGLPAGLNLLEFPDCNLNPLVGTGFANNDMGQILVSTACGWLVWEDGVSTPIPTENNLSIQVLTDINNEGQVVGYGSLFGEPELCNGSACAILLKVGEAQ